MNYRYIKGSEHRREAVEFDLKELHPTTCVVDVDLLLCGITAVRCVNDAYIILTLEQQRDILNLVTEERGKMIHAAGPKSMQSWEESGLGSFDEFFLPGDTVTEDVYDNFLDILPPATMRQNLLQVGEPAAHEKDPDTGKYRATYSTFVRTDGLWWYAGECFLGETVNRRTRPGRLEKRLAEVEKLIKAEEHREKKEK